MSVPQTNQKDPARRRLGLLQRPPRCGARAGREGRYRRPDDRDAGGAHARAAACGQARGRQRLLGQARRPAEVLLPACAKHGTKFVTNGGGAAPEACAAMIARLAREHGLTMKVAAVTGDDVTELVRTSDPILLETGEPFSKLGTDIISTNAYLGADAIAAAYAAGADVIVTGRVTDRRSRSGRSWRRSAGRPTTWTRWRAACSPAICSNAAGRRPADISPSPA